ncbi:MAG: serine/threonine-protein kinase, partial [Balneolaceae bacterium]|nr:serine/threonine-protein kinase [Balneolaceae bacterium]
MEKGTSILHYEILDKLGEGGMGVVYKARDTKLNRTVALKFLPPHLTQSKSDQQRFIREAKAAAALNHPNICTIHQIEEHEKGLFIVMEYVEGQTLKEKLNDGALHIDLAIRYILQIADALAEAHDRGIIHRDIKSENIMIDQQDRVKVMDFGLAKISGSLDLTKTGSTLGTVPYMSPEQAMGKEVDHRTDIWSTGVLLYEMLTGQQPFKGEYDHALIYSIINEEIDPVSELPPSVPLQIRQCVDRMLEKDLEQRLSSAAELKEILKNAQPHSRETESRPLPVSPWWKHKAVIAVPV